MASLSLKEKDVICTTLFHALNWFREVVNAFATQIHPEMKGKVITRLHNITEVSKTLEQCLFGKLK
jgi:Fanconi anemia group D2 protein